MEISDNVGTFLFDTSQIDFLSNIYLVFNLATNMASTEELINCPSKLFDSVHFSYNGAESVLSSNFIIDLLKLHAPHLQSLDLLFEDKQKTIYVPMGFINRMGKLYVRNQNVCIQVYGIKKFKDVCIMYEVTQEPGIQPVLQWPINKISLELYSTYHMPFGEKVKIPLDNLTQCVYWNYQNSDGNFIHPIESASITGIYRVKTEATTNKSDQICEPRQSEFFNIQLQFQYVVNSNEFMYMYSIVKPDCFNPIGFFRRKYSDLVIEQKIKEQVNTQQQIIQNICVQSVKYIKLI